MSETTQTTEQVATETVSNTEQPTQAQATTATNNPQTDQIDAATITRNAQGVAYGHIDAVMAELGFEKPAGMKTSEWVKKTFSEKLAAQQTQQNQQPDQPNEWEEKAKALQRKLEESELQAKKIEQQIYQKQAEIAINATLDALNLQAPPQLEPEQAQRYVDAQRLTLKNMLTTDYETKVVNGQIVYYNKKTNEPEINNRGEFATPKDLINNNYSAFLIDFSQKRGVSVPDATASTAKRFKTTADIHAHIKKEMGNIPVGSRDYAAKFAELAKESNISF